VSRDQIFDAIWGADYVAESYVVDRHVRTLRTKLHDDFRHPRFIATGSGKGYRFISAFRTTGRDDGPVPSKQAAD